ncbi:hypothetical protein NDU88_000037 [Pleurodeles waltl]|uniref:Uncharacterized protein n=1 Tax=Pleurodeles waltl TaxID=8319 RepID=A0AAV7UNW0_PLEWA|nr:hypothetical protein NDU88_000037 [Pleurodeles waltl]
MHIYCTQLQRQAFFEKARLDVIRSFEGNILSRQDICHMTVERRYRMKQLIKLCQEKCAEAYLRYPAWLKIIFENRT